VEGLGLRNFGRRRNARGLQSACCHRNLNIPGDRFRIRERAEYISARKAIKKERKFKVIHDEKRI